MTEREKRRAVSEIDRLDLRLMELAVDVRSNEQARRAIDNAVAALRRARLFVKGEVIA